MFFAFFFSVVNGAGFAMVSLFFSFLSTCYLGVFCCLSFHEFSSCLLLPREQTADFLYRWASHGQAEPLASSLFGRALLALSFHDCFRVLLETGASSHGQAEPLASSLFGRAFLALSFHDCFRVLLETGGNARNAFVLPSRDLLRLFRASMDGLTWHFFSLSLCFPAPYRRPRK